MKGAVVGDHEDGQCQEGDNLILGSEGTDKICLPNNSQIARLPITIEAQFSVAKVFEWEPSVVGGGVEALSTGLHPDSARGDGMARGHLSVPDCTHMKQMPRLGLGVQVEGLLRNEDASKLIREIMRIRRAQSHKNE